MAAPPTAAPRPSTALACPVTALAVLPSRNDRTLAGSARDLVLLSSTADHEPAARWTVFLRERIHRIVWRESRGRGDAEEEALVLGGKEAVLVRLCLPPNDSPQLEVRVRFALDDVVVDGAFLSDDQVLLATVHCTLHIYHLPLPPSSAPAESRSGLLGPVQTLHAPQRPLLWGGRFSRPHYYEDAVAAAADKGVCPASSEAPPAAGSFVRLAGGSMWGDTFLWDVAPISELLRELGRAETGARQAGCLRRLVGHKGAVFSTTFSSPRATRLATTSDDRTVRVWDLSRLEPLFVPPPSSSSSSSSGASLPEVEPGRVPHKVLWGHEGRVWRCEFLVPAQLAPAEGEGSSYLASVGEDATCRLWRLGRSPAAEAEDEGEGWRLVRTWRDGHDGRSIWSLATPVASGLEPDDGELASSRACVLTGGADGAVRRWEFDAGLAAEGDDHREGRATGPDAGRRKVTAFTVAARSAVAEAAAARGGSDAGCVVVTLAADGAFYGWATPTPSGLRIVAPPVGLKPFWKAPTGFAGAYGSNLVRLLPLATATQRTETWLLVALSNRGWAMTATLTVAPIDRARADPMVVVHDVREHETGVKANGVAFCEVEGGGGGWRMAVAERAGHRLVVFEVEVDKGGEEQGASLRQTGSLALDRARPSLLPTSLHFLSPTLLVAGTIRGHVSLFRLAPPSSPSPPAPPSSGADEPLTAHAAAVSGSATGRGSEIGRLEKIHEDAVNRIRVVQETATTAGEESWTVESIGRDGASCLLQVKVMPGDGGESGPALTMVDRRKLTRGSLEEHLPGGRYLALVDSRLVVLDRLAQTLEAYPCPRKKALAQVVRDPATNHVHHFCTNADALDHQLVLEGADLRRPTMLLPGLHGREIRAIASLRLLGDAGTLVATAAENGVLTISFLSADHRLSPLYRNRYLPGSYKSLAWSPATNPGDPHLLFACGTRAALSAISVDVVRSDGTVPELGVLPCGDELADEGEEVRAMSLTVVASESGAGRRVCSLAVGYSDGVVRTWSHDSEERAFTPERSSGLEASKCLLCVESVRIRPDGATQDRTLLITTASDGLLAIRDLTAFTTEPNNGGANGALPPPFFTLRPHPSGINAISAATSGPAGLLLATGGDDNVITVSALRFEAGRSEQELAAVVEASCSIVSAHASTIQGLDWVDSDSRDPASHRTLVSSAVDQRLNVYRLTHSPNSSSLAPEPATDVRAPPPERMSLDWIGSTCLDVADCSAQAIVPGRGENKDERTDGAGVGGAAAVVVGIGTEVVALASLAAE